MEIPFEFGIYGGYSKKACMCVFGWMYTGGGCDSAQNYLVRAFSYNPNYLALSIIKGTPTGIDYRVNGQAPSRSVVFRWYVAVDTVDHYYNFTATFYENSPGLVAFNYLFMFENGKDGIVKVSQSGGGPSDSFDSTTGTLNAGRVIQFNTGS